MGHVLLLVIFLAVVVAAALTVTRWAQWLGARRMGSGPPPPRTETVDAPLSMTLAFLARDRSSVAIAVRSPHGEARIYMRSGVIYHAVAGGGTGDQAMGEALRWDSSVTRVTVIRDFPLPAEKSVTMDLPDLLRAAGIQN